MNMLTMMNYNIQTNNIFKFKHCNYCSIINKYRLNYIIGTLMFQQSIL